MAEKKTTEQYFDTIIAEAIDVGTRKMGQYGTSWTSYRPESLLTRMFNKGVRIETIQDTGKNLVGEPVSGEFREIMTYAALLGMMIENSVARHSELPPDTVTQYRTAVFKKSKDVMISKNHDYGEIWREMSQKQIVDEVIVKIRRMRFTEISGRPVPVDNVYDIINYCAFALILIEEKAHDDL